MRYALFPAENKAHLENSRSESENFVTDWEHLVL
jgi:hypothetical protein